MTARNRNRIDEAGIYYHIYNKGVEKRIIFNDEEDYRVFIGYLEDYLAVPKDPDSVKKVFEIRGRTFRGTPHQPKNYFNEVELVAYKLSPDHFHLLLHQISKGSLEKFIRSLCTRYSIYFNNKHKRTGSLFEGPYKSIGLKDDKKLLSYLTYYLHHQGERSSYPEYLGSKKTPWVKIQGVLSTFKMNHDSYKHFIENYKLDQKEKELIDNVMFGDDSECIERRDLTSTQSGPLEPAAKPHSVVPHFFAVSSFLFLLLVGLGIRNIQVNQVNTSNLSQPLPAPQVLPAQTENIEPERESQENPRKTVIIKTGDEFSIVNIREKPATDSAKIGSARDGDVFEFVSETLDWYEIKLASESSGFISGDYAEKQEKINYE